MAQRFDDCATVLTGSSSLRNFTYTPSVTCDTECQTNDENCDSVLSSVKSSVKRDYQKRMCQGVTEEDSRSDFTILSEGILWQDTETEVDFYSSSTDEEQGRDSVDKYPLTLGSQSNTRAQLKMGCESSTEATSESEESSGSRSQSNMPWSSNLIAAFSQGSRDVYEGSTHIVSSMSTKKRCELQYMCFSIEAVGEIVQSRKVVRTQPMTQEMLHMDYDSAIDVASTNKDISTFHPLQKEDCDDVFKKRQWVPFEVPISHGSSDDFSSIQALSTKVPMPATAHENTEEHLQQFLGEKSLSTPLPEIQVEVECDTCETAVKNSPCSSSAKARWWHLQFLENRKDGELFLMTIVGASFTTLIILLVILYAI